MDAQKLLQLSYSYVVYSRSGTLNLRSMSDNLPGSHAGFEMVTPGS